MAHAVLLCMSTRKDADLWGKQPYLYDSPAQEKELLTEILRILICYFARQNFVTNDNKNGTAGEGRSISSLYEDNIII